MPVVQGLTYEGLRSWLQGGAVPPQFHGPPIPKPAPTSWGGHGYPGFIGPPIQKPPNPPGFIGPAIHPGPWQGPGYGGAPHASPHPTALGLPPHTSPHPLGTFPPGTYSWPR